MEKATFAAGCFWGVEEEFRTLNGVISTRVGYDGGHSENPTYPQVCGGNTGHAESVEVTFDPKMVSYTQLLDKFWALHDPTTKNRQGPDVGTQYRSVIFFHSKQQQKEAEESRTSQQKKYDKPITTEIVPEKEFFQAEEYHQKYVLKTGDASCHI